MSPGADPEHSERGGRKMYCRERDIAPYPQHMTGILGPIEKYHAKDSWLQKHFKKSLKGWGGGEGGDAPPRPPLNPPMESEVAHNFRILSGSVSEAWSD